MSMTSRTVAALMVATCTPMAAAAQVASVSPAPSPEPVPVSITVDAGQSEGALPPAWRFFGADEPNYATMKDGRKLIAELGGLKPDHVYFRTHNLLNTGDGTSAFKWGSTNIYTEDARGRPVYDWTVVDRIIDTYRANGVKPYLQLGFMPQALSSAPKGTPYQHNWRPGFKYDLITGAWAYPPSDYGKWAELVYQWTLHNVQRYGRKEVESWYFEVWNEPNGPAYWHGTPEEFYKLHDYAVDAVRRALPTARVGGPDVAGHGGAFMDGFLTHVATGKNYATAKVGTPTDFLSFHAKGRPEYVDGHVRMGIATQLKAVDTGFSKVAAAPTLKDKPIVIGESDPEGCAACPGPQNAYRNGTMYSSYTVASMARIWDLARVRKVNIEGILSWSFTFEDQPWFAGYRQLATNGIDLPVMNVMRLFAKLGPDRVAAISDRQVPLDQIVAQGVRGAADIGSLATRTPDGKLAVLVWHYHDDDLPGPDAAVRLSLTHLGRKISRATVWKVDGDHANAFTAWKAMGSPQSPNDTQYTQLERAAVLTAEPTEPVKTDNGTAELRLRVPRQGVALVELE